jgi:thiamine-monophosphate kinase
MSDDAIDSEESIIQEFLAPLAAGFSGAFDLQDDCAVLAPEPGSELVVKTDPIIAGVHFLADTDAADIAWKALAVNVSDLAAKGATPVAYLMALALPQAPQRGWMQRLAAGLADAQRAFGCHLIGGDTDRTPGPLTISITALGTVPAGKMVRRGAARPGDQLFVTGTLGDAALGLQLLTSPSLAKRLLLADADVAALVRRHVRPQPRLALAPLLRAHARAAMDISDGLVKDCRRMCAASGVGARLHQRDIPLSPSLERAGPEWHLRALTRGDDYEILAAIPEECVAAFLADADALDFRVTRIGEIAEGSGVTVERPDGTPISFDRAGWDHFA